MANNKRVSCGKSPGFRSNISSHRKKVREYIFVRIKYKFPAILSAYRMTFADIISAYWASVITITPYLYNGLKDILASVTSNPNFFWQNWIFIIIFCLMIAFFYRYLKLHSSSLELNKVEVIEKLSLSQAYCQSGYRIYEFENGDEQEHYVMSEQINLRLQNQNPLLIKILRRCDHKFQLPKEVRPFTPYILNKDLHKGKCVFNNKLLRQCESLYLDTDMVSTERVTYFEGLCSHEIAYKEYYSNLSLKAHFSGLDFLQDDGQKLLPLERSYAGNHMGVSTLVITQDNQMIIGVQGAQSNTYAGKAQLSGSGSVQFIDATSAANRTKDGKLLQKDQRDLKQILATAAEREFIEENRLTASVVSDCIATKIVAYMRLLDRGGKPDYLAISYLDMNGDEIEKMREINMRSMDREKGLEELPLLIKLEAGETPREALERKLREFTDKKVPTIQLYVLLKVIDQSLNLEYLLEELKTELKSRHSGGK